jgi:hypothetical protein
MDQDTLVRPDLDAGRELIRRLESAGSPVDTAYWLQDDETGIWQLVISSPLVASRGPRRIYDEIWKILLDLHTTDLNRHEISVVGPYSSLVRDLKEQVGTGEDLQEIRLDDLHIGGHKYRSSRIYRAAGGKIENGARVQVKSSGRIGTVRGRLRSPNGPRYLVVYDLTPNELERVGIDLRPPIGDELSAEDLTLLYVVRTGGWPERLPHVTLLAG